MATDRVSLPARQRRVQARRIPSLALLGLMLAVGCFAQRPSGEAVPSTAPEAPEPRSTQPLVLPPPAPNEAEERKGDSRAPGKDAAAERSTGAASPTAAPAPPRPQKQAAPKARGLPRPEAAHERSASEIGGAVTEPDSEPGELRRRLDRAYRAGSPDCPSARDRKKAVCDLASQICQLIDRDPNVASVAEYCADAKDRCAEAERRTRERCPD